MEIHAHGFLLLVVFFWRGLSRILRGILCLSISGSQPLTIELRHWPQTWRRAIITSLSHKPVSPIVHSAAVFPCLWPAMSGAQRHLAPLAHHLPLPRVLPLTLPG